MAHAEICPICGGKGVKRDLSDLTTGQPQRCHGCGGLGWITVGTEYPLPRPRKVMDMVDMDKTKKKWGVTL